LSRESIEKEGKQDLFEFIHAVAHELADFSQYDLIWIAAMVPEKMHLLNVIARTARPGTRIIVRQTVGLGQLWILPYETVRQHSGFKAGGQNQIGVCESLLLTKQ
jgi:hypothetical protein